MPFHITFTTFGKSFLSQSHTATLTLPIGDRWKPFDSSRNWPDLGERFIQGERAARKALRDAARNATRDSASGSPSSEPHAGSTLQENDDDDATWEDRIENDKLDLDWATVLKRTFESYIRGERPNMYGEWIVW